MSPYAARKVLSDGRHAGVTVQLYNAMLWVGPDPDTHGYWDDGW